MLGHHSRPTRHLLATAVAALTLLGAAATTTSPADAAALPSRATWLKATEKAMVGSRAALADRVDDARKGERLAIVMDIDNTSLQSHYAYPRAVPAVLRYATYARSRGVSVMFATGRSSSQMTGVADKLRAAGYDFTSICTRRSGESLAQGKVRCRAGFQQQGYALVAMVGNRETDFTGGRWERSWRLPNYGNRLG